MPNIKEYTLHDNAFVSADKWAIKSASLRVQ